MGIASTTSMPRVAGALAFLEKAHELGAGGIQTGINGETRELRTRAEQLGMYTEAFLALPRNGDTAAFERSLTTAKEAGAICAYLRAAASPCCAISGLSYVWIK